MFQVLDENNPGCMKPLLETCAQLRASTNFSFEAEVDVVIGRAVSVMGSYPSKHHRRGN